MPGWRIASDGREVSIVQCCRLLEMDVISGVIMCKDTYTQGETTGHNRT